MKSQVARFAAHAQGSSFDTGFNAIQSLFTGTIAKVASLVGRTGPTSVAHSGTEGCGDSLGRGKLPQAESPGARLFFRDSRRACRISRSGAFRNLLHLRGSPGIHRLKRPGHWREGIFATTA